MSYVETYKLFFASRNTFEEQVTARRNSEQAIRLPFQIGEQDAFCVLTQKMQRQISTILRQDKQLYAIEHQLPAIALPQYTRKCLIDEIVLTNDIEGVHSTRREIGEVLDDLAQKDRHHRFFGLVSKYNMLQTHADQLPKTCADIRELYNELVLPELKEEDFPDGMYFRTESVAVLSATGKVLHQGLLPESRIIETMQQALNILNDESIDLIIRIALFHYMFGYIHPFYDGNGRTSRFISSLLLSTQLEAITSYQLSYTIKQHLTTYYKAFEHCNDPRSRGDMTEFVHMFLFMIQNAQQEIIDHLSARYHEWEHLCKQFVLSYSTDQTTTKMLDLLIQAALFSENGITVIELAQVCGCSENTVRRRLNEFKKADLLLIDIIKRMKYYRLNLSKVDADHSTSEAE